MLKITSHRYKAFAKYRGAQWGGGGGKVLIQREHLIEEISELKARGRRALMMSLIGY